MSEKCKNIINSTPYPPSCFYFDDFPPAPESIKKNVKEEEELEGKLAGCCMKHFSPSLCALTSLVSLCLYSFFFFFFFFFTDLTRPCDSPFSLFTLFHLLFSLFHLLAFYYYSNKKKTRKREFRSLDQIHVNSKKPVWRHIIPCHRNCCGIRFGDKCVKPLSHRLEHEPPAHQHFVRCPWMVFGWLFDQMLSLVEKTMGKMGV